ncbi:MAG: preprotein translocase subunit SecY [Candidatus Nanoarchaeia archaeon]|nr:preprotein translocase subunit SecY [Candidatus Jingweiarchaeum tengchongense]
MALKDLLFLLPEVEKPKKRLSLKEKLTWTSIVLILYFVLSLIPLYGLNKNYVSRFEALAVLLAAQFGSLITLGIGPIVTGSIVLQLMMGAEIIKIDTQTPEGKNMYEGLHKLFSVAFIFLENGMYVLSGALPPAYPSILISAIMILQLILGGFILMLLDEISSKWGIGSGISLFIVAGVAREIFVQGFSPFSDPSDPSVPYGAIPKIISLLIQGRYIEITWPLLSIIATLIVFALATFLQSINVQVPLSFGRVRGFGIRWPINFMYTSNIPVILTASLVASLQFWGIMLCHANIPILGRYERIESITGGYREVPVSGIAKYLEPPHFALILFYGLTKDFIISTFVYLMLMLSGAVIFSILWTHVGGQDPASVAKQILSSGLSVPGFRRDDRVIERILARYIFPLTVMGGLAVGFLSVFADLFGALSRGTGILLAVMIIYGFYQQVMRTHLEELHPLARKLLSA